MNPQFCVLLIKLIHNGRPLCHLVFYALNVYFDTLREKYG